MVDNSLLNVLLIESDCEFTQQVIEKLGDAGGPSIKIQCANALSSGLDRLSRSGFDAVLLDLNLSDSNGLDTFRSITTQAPVVPIVVLSEVADTATAHAAVQSGAQDYLLKTQCDTPLLSCSLRYAVERRQLQQQLWESSSHDLLTGLANRTKFVSHVQQTIDGASRHSNASLAVMLVDIDHFKNVNSGLGDELADQLLCQVARRLEQTIGRDDVLARFCGDVFAILTQGIGDKVDVVKIANQIQDALRVSFALLDEDVYIDTSIGIAVNRASENDTRSLLCDAEAALLRAKEQGGACHVVFEPDTQAPPRLELEKDLRRALQRGEFRIHYQPIISLETRRISGFEALVRWEHPERGLLSPLEFIATAEQTGLIIPLGLWVLNEACVQMRTWQEQFPHAAKLSLNVNVSSKQLSQPDLLDEIDAILTDTEFDADRLELEITESAIIDNDEIATRMFRKLGDRGVRLSIDDFGMGYSSLSYLHRFAFDTLKIDRSFVGRLHDKEQNSDVFVRTIVSLAKDLGMDVIAEGVETEPQLAHLSQLKCDYAQGYYFSRPVDPTTVGAVLAEEFESIQQDSRDVAKSVPGSDSVSTKDAEASTASRTLEEVVELCSG